MKFHRKSLRFADDFKLCREVGDEEKGKGIRGDYAQERKTFKTMG